MLNYGTQTEVLGPLTAAQRSIWVAQQLRPEVPYNFAGFVTINHDVDAERLMVACESMAARFGTPCARLALEDGEPVFVVDRSFPQTMHCIDLRAEPDAAAAARRWMDEEYRRLSTYSVNGSRTSPYCGLPTICRTSTCVPITFSWMGTPPTIC
jgi:hypothetical protein